MPLMLRTLVPNVVRSVAHVRVHHCIHSGELSLSPGIAESGSGSGCLDRSMPLPFGAVMDRPGCRL